MKRQLSPAPRRKSKLWPRLRADTRPNKKAHRRWSTAAPAVVAVGGLTFGLLVFGLLLQGLGGRHEAPRDAAAAAAAPVADQATGELRLVKHFQSFEEYVTEMMVSSKALPVPVVDPPEGDLEGTMALPLATIIGVQVQQLTLTLCDVSVSLCGAWSTSGGERGCALLRACRACPVRSAYLRERLNPAGIRYHSPAGSTGIKT